MNEVDVVAGGDSRQERGFFLFVNPVPTHVRDLETSARFKSYHSAGKQIEAALQAEFFTFRKQQLETQTDAEKRSFLPHDLSNGFDQPKALEILHAGPESSNAGEHNPSRGGNLAGLARNLGRMASPLEAFLHASEIAHSIVNDRDHNESATTRLWSTTRLRSGGPSG